MLQKRGEQHEEHPFNTIIGASLSAKVSKQKLVKSQCHMTDLTDSTVDVLPVYLVKCIMLIPFGKVICCNFGRLCSMVSVWRVGLGAREILQSIQLF